MKKIMFLIGTILSLLLLIGCKKIPDKQTVHVLMPGGSPTLAFVQMIHTVDEIENMKVSYEVTSIVKELPTAITSKTYEIVVAPTNLGANLYNKDSGYVYAGAITFGNLFLVGKSSENTTLDINDLDKQTIAAFGRGSIPQILLESILKFKGFNIVDEIDQNSVDKQVVITYFDSLSTTNSQLITDQYDYALLAEPILSVAKTKNLNIQTIIDIQDGYKLMTGKENYPQAGIFINQEFIEENEQFVETFLTKVKTSTEFVTSNKEEAANYYNLEQDIITPQFPKTVLVEAISGSNIRFETARDSKTDLNQFLQIIYDYNPLVVGGEIPNDDFYLG